MDEKMRLIAQNAWQQERIHRLEQALDKAIALTDLCLSLWIMEVKIGDALVDMHALQEEFRQVRDG